jgi:hypothetical protein
MLKEKVYLFIGSFCIGSGSYLIHPGLGLIVVGAVFLIWSYNEYEERVYGNKNTEEADSESGGR